MYVAVKGGERAIENAHAWLAERVDVPVINPGPLSYKLASVALDLGLSHS